jgi:hypothetical protein
MRSMERVRLWLGGIFCAASTLLAPIGSDAFDFREGHFYAISGQRITQYDDAGERIEALDLTGRFTAPNRELRGLAFGPDGLLYVAQSRDPGNGFRVIALDEAGQVHSVFEDPAALWNNLGFGKLAFDEAGFLYVGTNSGLVRFDPTQPAAGELFYDAGQVIDVEALPGGGLLILGSGLRELDAAGGLVRRIEPTDPNGIAGGLFFLSSPHGVEYDPEADEIYLSMGGFTGQQHRVMRVDPDGVLRAITTFINPQDLYFSAGQLVVGSRTFAPGLFDSDLMQLRLLGPERFDDHFFVTRLEKPDTIVAEIDIEPGRRTALVNPQSRRPIRVAVLGSDRLHVDEIDVSSLAFGPQGAAPSSRDSVLDLNADDVADRVFRFQARDTGIAPGDVEACLLGETLDATGFEGCDAIRTVPPGCGPGFELALLLPAIVVLRHSRRREECVANRRT